MDRSGVGASTALQVRVLGPIELLVDGSTVALGRQQEVLVAVLIAQRAAAVRADRLIEAVWGGRLPSDPGAALRSLVARTRRTLGPAAGRLQTAGNGYRLVVEPSELDAARFEALVQRSTETATAGDRLPPLDEALGLWRDVPYGMLGARDELRPSVLALEELVAVARQQRAGALMELGRYTDAVLELERFVAAEPLREEARAMLMAALAATGRATDALAVYRAWADELAERGLEPSPQLRATEAEVLRHEQAAAVPRWRALLPRPLSSLVGRDGEVAGICSMLPGARLVTLVGPGGVGKTRMVLAAADRLVPRFPDGVWFCDLSAAATAGEAVDIVATTIAAVVAGDDPLTVQLARHLQDSTCLVVLDNVERVAAGATAVAEALTARTAAVAVLATSRQRLGADGERVVTVDPLPVAGPDSPAVELFLERSAAVTARAPLADTAEERAIVERLCRRLDGLPLAIELAAARTKALSPAELDEQLRLRPGLLTDRQRTNARHRSLTALIDWSHDGLDDPVRAAFRRLGVFRAAFTLDAAEQVLDEVGGPVAVDDVLVELVERSLLRRYRDRSGTSRYQALDAIRAFMLDRLAQAGEMNAAMAAHARWAADFAERAEAGLRGPQEAAWAAAVHQQFDDLRAAVDWSIEAGSAEARRIAVALQFYALWRGVSELFRWAERAAEALGVTDASLAGATWAGAASGAWQRGNLARSRALLDAGSAAVTGVPSPLGRRRLAEVTADLALLTGALDEAIVRYGEARDLALAAGDVAQAVWDEASRALAQAYGGAPSAALGTAASALRLAKRAGAPSLVAYAHFAVAESALGTDPARARRHLSAAAGAAATVGADYLVALVRLSEAALASRSRDARSALGRFEHLLTAWRASGGGTGLAVTVRSLIPVLVELGVDDGAAVLHGAVSDPVIGPPPYGEDAARLQAAAARLRDRLGERFEVLVARGRRLDEEQLAAEALRWLLLAGPAG